MLMKNKHSKKSRRASVSEYEYLKKELRVQKDKLEQLYQSKEDTKKTDNNSNFCVVKINDLEELNNLKSWIVLYSNLGYSMEEYYDLWQKGELEEKLEKDGYTELACERAKEYIEEKGTTLTKRLKRKNR